MTNEEKESLAGQAYERAWRYEVEFGCCPQCVLASVQEAVGIVSDDTIKAVHGLSGGGSLMAGGTCGALTGGLVALSAKYGRDRDLSKGRGINNFRKGKALVERFRETFGGITCEDLQQRFTGRTWDMWQPEEYKGFSEARGDKCAEATALVTQWVVEELAP